MCYYPNKFENEKLDVSQLCLRNVHSRIPETNRSALHQASINGDINCIKALVRRGSNMDDKDKDGHTPLELALLQNKCKVATYLTKLGASTKMTKGAHSRALNICLRRGKLIQVIKYIFVIKK